MSVVSDIWQPNTSQTGPPPWSRNPHKVSAIVVDSVAQLRELAFSPGDMERPQMVLLTGEFSAYDGQLQGIYLKYPPNREAYGDDGASKVYSNDGTILWRKLT